METIRLLTCDNNREASIIKGRLENEGIECFLTNENFSTLMPHFFGILGAGVQIVVNKTDYEKAVKLLDLDQSAQNELVCPNCKSTNIGFGLGRKKSGKITTILLSLLAGVPFNNINNRYYCRDCNADFKIYHFNRKE